MLIKEHKIFIYNNYLDKEIDIIIKLTINIKEIMQDRFIYEIFQIKNQDFILKMF